MRSNPNIGTHIGTLFIATCDCARIADVIKSSLLQLDLHLREQEEGYFNDDEG